MENATFDDYIAELTANGLFVVDGNGAGSLNQPAADILAALHEVLAGGSVTITVDTAGSTNVKATLDTKLTATVGTLNVPDGNGGTIFTP